MESWLQVYNQHKCHKVIPLAHVLAVRELASLICRSSVLGVLILSVVLEPTEQEDHPCRFSNRDRIGKAKQLFFNF